MTDHDSLLRAVTDNPAEDVPRLMFADALDERGWKGDRERAEFVRVQVAIGVRRHPSNYHYCYHPDSAAITQKLNGNTPCYCHDCKLDQRERELLEMMVPREPWPDRTPRYTQGRYYFAECGCPLAGFSLRRGFLEQITVTTENFLAHAAEIFTRHPVERVTLAGKEPGQERNNRADPLPWYWIETDLTDANATSGWIRTAICNFGDRQKLNRTMGDLYDFKTRQEAVDWLSDACVAFGRAAAAKARLGAAVAI